MQVEYIDHMGSDLSVVNAARVSFDKKSDWIWKYPNSDLEHDRQSIDSLARFNEIGCTWHLSKCSFN